MALRAAQPGFCVSNKYASFFGSDAAEYAPSTQEHTSLAATSVGKTRRSIAVKGNVRSNPVTISATFPTGSEAPREKYAAATAISFTRQVVTMSPKSKMPHGVALLGTLGVFFGVLIFLFTLVGSEMAAFLDDPVIQENMKQLGRDYDQFLNDSDISLQQP